VLTTITRGEVGVGKVILTGMTDAIPVPVIAPAFNVASDLEG